MRDDRDADPARSTTALAAEIRRALLDYERRVGKPVKKSALARTVGVSTSSLYAYLNGVTLPPADTFDRLLAALDGSAAERRRLAVARDDLAIAGAFAKPRHAPATALRQLPTDITEFAGRESELRHLGELVDTASGLGTAVVISSIEGMAGVGKTRLAIRAAHQIVGRGRFDEAQLWVDLRGFDPDQGPADPSEVLAMFLRLLGVPGEQVPGDLPARRTRIGA